MAAEFDLAVARFIATCAYVTAVHDLITKWRLELVGISLTSTSTRRWASTATLWCKHARACWGGTMRRIIPVSLTSRTMCTDQTDRLNPQH